MSPRFLLISALAVLLVSAFPCTAAMAMWVELPGAWSSGPAYQVQIEESAVGLTTVRFRLRGFERSEEAESRFETISVPGLATTRTPGLPALPVAGVAMLLEQSGEIVAVRESTRLFDGVVPSPFVGRPKRCGGGAWRRVCDTSFYNGDGSEVFPGERVVVVEQGRMRDAAAMVLELSPFAYHPNGRKLVVSYEMEVDISSALFRGGEGRYRTRSLDEIGRFAFHSMLQDGREDGAREVFLVIAHDSLVAGMEEFVDWKEKLGFDVHLVALSQAGDSYQELQGFIAEAYATWESPPAYVLLVGDGNGQGKVPYVPSPYGCASDFLYTTLDGGDLFPELLIGRFSAHSEQELEVQVAQSLWYEGQVESTGATDWISSSVCISSSEGSGGSNDDYRSDVICGLQVDAGYSPADKLYHSLGNDTAVNLSSKVNVGRGWLTYLGHGDGHAWATTEPPYSNSHVQALTNGFLLPFVVDVSCSNGSFDSASGDCFAEAWMKTGTAVAPRGAVGIYSSTTPTAWDEPAEMAVGMTKALLEQGIYNWSAVAAAGRAYSMQVLPGGGHEEVCHQYVVFGDPTLLLRTSSPQALEVEHPSAIPLGGYDFPVLVKKNGAALEGATVVVALPGGSSVVAKSSESGAATLWVDASQVGESAVIVFAPNALVYEATVDTLVPGCGLVQGAPVVANCSTVLDVVLFDADLNMESGQVDEALVQASSPSDPAVRNVVMEETGADTGKFTGKLELASEPGQLSLGVEHGGEVTLTYVDESCDGTDDVKTFEVAVDCEAPALSQVEFTEVGATSAVLKFFTDEPASGLVRFSAEVPPEDGVLFSAGLSHEVLLPGLAPSTTYFADLTASDSAANMVLDDNDGDYHQFTTQACVPDCGGKECGPDGCGGVCGSCCDEQTCEDGMCIGGPGCEVSYDPGCGGCPCESCVCEQDPYCCTVMWDDLCIEECVAQCGGCGGQADCAGKECGSNGCGGSCGECPGGWECTDSGECVDNCEADCVGKECGGDGCSGQCGECGEGAKCVDGLCLLPCDGVDFVGCCDGDVQHYCEEGFEFKVDCGAEGLKCGWKDFLGWYDCMDEQKPDPSGIHPLWCPGVCPPECEGKECGPDGCGGQCGSCAEDEHCVNGSCALLCKPQCDGKACGPDGCGTLCGECPMGLVCTDGSCEDTCVNQCEGKECGDDGCGGNCGLCVPGMVCSADYFCVLYQEEEDVVEVLPQDEPAVEVPGKGGGCSSSPASSSMGSPPFGLVLFVLLFLIRRTRWA